MNDGELMCHLVTELKALDTQLSSWLESASQSPVVPVDTYVDDLDTAWALLKEGMGRNGDVLLRKIQVPACGQELVLIASVDGLTDTQMIDQDIIRPLLATDLPPDRWDQGAMTPIHISTSRTWSDILQKLAAGNTLVFAPGVDHVWIVDTVKYPQRAIERPQTELAARGSEEAFNEVLLTQKTQIRRRVRSPALLFRDVSIGRLQHITVSVAYLESLANPSLVATAIDRLNAVHVDGITEITAIAGLIRDHPRSIFPTIRQTERVDLAVWRLLEGAVVILMDGDPFVLVAPAPLVDFYRTAMDYSSSWIDTSFVRMIRFIGWLMGMYLPALYIALAEINPSILPSSLFIIIQGSNAGLAFSPLVQVILMIVVIETLREAAFRLPKALSTAISTVGAIVVGTAVVKAGFVDPQIIVIMTLTALSLFSTPVYELTATWRVIGFLLTLAGAIFGIFGIVIVTVGVMAVLVDMRTFGSPYFAPWAPFRRPDWSDAIWRLPWTNLQRRWTAARPQNQTWRTAEAPDLQAHLNQAQDSPK